MSAIFISHSSRDNEFCVKLMAWLDDLGHRSVFLDIDASSGIAAGYNWEQKLYQELRACRAVIVVCTENLMNSKWCFAEITQARSLGKHIFPIKIAECKIDSVLSDSQVVDFLRFDEKEAFERLKQGLAIAGIDAEDPYDWDGSRSPYPGLLSFQEADAAIFFGRDKEIGDGLDVLNGIYRYGGSGLVMTLGASGSGKSSLVRAGIVPRLKRDPERWLVIDPFQPGEDPFLELAKVLSAAYRKYAKSKRKADNIRESLMFNEASVEKPATSEDENNVGPVEETPLEIDDLHDAIKTLESLLQSNAIGSNKSKHSLLRSSLKDLQKLRNEFATPNASDNSDNEDGSRPDFIEDILNGSGRENASLLIIIDQFEELLNRPQDHLGNQFLNFIRRILNNEDNKIVVIGTMRSDFLGAFQQNPALRSLEYGKILVGPVDNASISEIVEKPAELAGVRIEPKLLQALIEDAGTDDALPLLAFTLRELYDKFADDNFLEYREYKDFLGGIQGAVAKAAEDVLAKPSLSKIQEDNLRKAFLFMARVNEDGNFTREVAKWNDMPTEVHGVLERLVEGRLLVSGGGEENQRTIQVAHETIFKSWKRLKKWLDEDREFLLWRRRLNSAKEEWIHNERDKSTLLNGPVLHEAKNWADRYKDQLEEEERQFVSESIRISAKRQFRKRVMIFSGMTLLGLIGVAMFLLYLDANEQKMVANQNLRTATEREMQAAAITITTLEERTARNEHLEAFNDEVSKLEDYANTPINERPQLLDSLNISKQNREKLGTEVQLASVKTADQIAAFDQGVPLQLGKVDENQWAKVDSTTFFKGIHNVGLLQDINKFNSEGRWFPLEKLEDNGIADFQDFLIDAGFLVQPRLKGVFGYRTHAAAMLWYEYMSTVEKDDNISVGVPDGAFGIVTRYHKLRYIHDSIPKAWTGSSILTGSAEYSAWINRLERIKSELSIDPTLALKKVEAFSDSSSTLKVREWDFRPEKTHLVGIRRNASTSSNRRPNDDLFILLVNGIVYKFYGSTDPNARMAGRTDEAFLAEGQHIYHKSWHKISSETKIYQALKPFQQGVLVFRDWIDDNALTEADLNTGLDPNPNFTINIHWSGVGKVSWSAGSQVIAGGKYINPNQELIDYRGKTAVGYSSLGSTQNKSFLHKGAYTVFIDLIWALSLDDEVRYTLLDEAVFNDSEREEIANIIQKLIDP